MAKLYVLRKKKVAGFFLFSAVHNMHNWIYPFWNAQVKLRDAHTRSQGIHHDEGIQCADGCITLSFLPFFFFSFLFFSLSNLRSSKATLNCSFVTAQRLPLSCL